mmetsp:Transcript_7817/g.12242  ORF Transcript_7817/g.12242 Transcript_7817/m.12242 type:complete len:162 (-) Transcript_7817:48-533(-)
MLSPSPIHHHHRSSRRTNYISKHYLTMKVLAVFSSLLIGGLAFVTPQHAKSANFALKAMVPKDQMTPDQLEILGIQEKWNEYRHYSREEAASKLEGEWLEAYNRYYEGYDKDMEFMLEIKEKVAKMIEPPKVAKKGKKQRKRDLWAKKQAQAAADAAAANV